MKIGNMRFFQQSNRPLPAVASHPAVVGTSLLGVEIEVENAISLYNEYHGNSGSWTLKTDGSLRNGGIELVMTRPLGGEKLFRSLVEATEMLNSHPIDKSWRCSTHVHMNIKDITVPQLKLLILTFAVFEKVLFKCGAFNRYKSNFCMPYDLAQQMITTLSNHWHLTDSDFVNTVSCSWSKYSSLNLKPIKTLGSVELRIGNAETGLNELLAMCNRLLTLKDLAIGWTRSEEEYINFLSVLPFNNIFNKTVCLEYEVCPEDIERGVKNAMDILTLHKLRVATQNRMRFTTRLDDDDVAHYMSYAYENLQSETYEEHFQNLNWDDLSVSDVNNILNYLPISPESLLNEEDATVYQMNR